MGYEPSNISLCVWYWSLSYLIKFRYCSHLAACVFIHSGDTLFICDMCNVAFSPITSLNRHKNVHTRNK